VIPLIIVDGGIPIKEQEAKATIDMRVVDVETGETMLAMTEEGTAKQSSAGLIVSDKDKGVNGGVVGAEFGGLKARAIEAAVAKLGNKILEEVGGEYANVLSVAGKTVRISRGAKSGVQKDDIYLVYADGPEIFDLDGTPLGRDRFPIASIKVVDVQGGFSNCTVADGGGKASNIQRGDRLQLISAKESKEYVTRKVFPKERPRKRAYEDTAAQLHGGRSVSPAPEGAPEFDAAPGGEEMFEDETEPEVRPQIEPPRPAAPAPRPARGGAFAWKEVDGVDRNATTDAKLIETYPLKPADKNMIGIQHRGAYKLYTRRKYKDAFQIFSKLAADFDCNYLSAYWAGVCAVKLKSGKEAEKWFDRALSINENYEPAIKEKAKLGGNPTNRTAKKKGQ
jgi:TolA-binding protein